VHHRAPAPAQLPSAAGRPARGLQRTARV